VETHAGKRLPTTALRLFFCNPHNIAMKRHRAEDARSRVLRAAPEGPHATASFDYARFAYTPAIHAALGARTEELKAKFLDAACTSNISDMEFCAGALHRGVNCRLDNYGRTALHIAAWENQIFALRWLLASGADTSICTYGHHIAPLHYAAKTSPECTRRLLDAGDSPNVKTSDGMTPLHFAVRGGQEECVRMLVLHPDVDRGIRNRFGKTAEAMARELELDGLADAIRDGGAERAVVPAREA
jgi:hypothetical protein